MFKVYSGVEHGVGDGTEGDDAQRSQHGKARAQLGSERTLRPGLRTSLPVDRVAQFQGDAAGGVREVIAGRGVGDATAGVD